MSNAMESWGEFSVEVKGQPLTCLLAEPNELSDRPALLLNFASDSATTLKTEPYSITPRMFLDAGHRALSFDLPCHGDRAVPGQPKGIAGFCAEWVRGTDVFAGFVEEGHAVIDALIERKLAEPDRIFVSGTSRGGYCALRLMAADERIRAAAAFSPVTDWRVLKEFASVKNAPEVADLALTCFSAALVGRTVWTAIGNCDARVGTDACLPVCGSRSQSGSGGGVFVLTVRRARRAGEGSSVIRRLAAARRGVFVGVGERRRVGLEGGKDGRIPFIPSAGGGRSEIAPTGCSIAQIPENNYFTLCTVIQTKWYYISVGSLSHGFFNRTRYSLA